MEGHAGCSGAVPPDRCEQGDEVRRRCGSRQTAYVFLQLDGYWQRWGVGFVADRGAEHGVVFPRRAARAYVGACSGSEGELRSRVQIKVLPGIPVTQVLLRLRSSRTGKGRPT